MIRGYLSHNAECLVSPISRAPVLPVHPLVYEDALQRLKAGVILDEVKQANRKLFKNRGYKDMPTDLATSRYRWLLTQKDHRSLYRQLQRLQGVRVIEKDYINLHEWLDPNSPQFKKPLYDAIFHYSPRTSETERLELCIATSEMKEAAWKYAHHSQVLLDGTFGICDKKMLLFIVMGVDEANRGVPLAFFLFSAPEGNQRTSAGYNTDVLERLLKAWREEMGSRNGEAFEVWVAITDTDLIERSALILVFPHILLLICKFHLRQSWKNYRNKSLRGSTSEYDDIRQRLRRLEDLLVESEDILSARALVSNERESMMVLQDANECDSAVIDGVLKYLEYLDTYWLRDNLWQSWSRAGRLRAAILMKRPINDVVPTTNHLESFNGVLKRKHLRRWQNNGRRLRLDILVQVLVLCALPSIFEQRSLEDLESRRWETLLHGLPGGSAIVNSTRQVRSDEPFVPLAYWSNDDERDRGAASLVAHNQISVPVINLDGRSYTFTCFSSISLAHDTNPITYAITIQEDGVTHCSCPDFQARGGACKHIRAAVVRAKVLRELQAIRIPDLRAWIPNSLAEASSLYRQTHTSTFSLLPTSSESDSTCLGTLSSSTTLPPIARASIAINEMVRESKDLDISTTEPIVETTIDGEPDFDMSQGATRYEDSEYESDLTGSDTDSSQAFDEDEDLDESLRPRQRAPQDEFAELARTNQQAINEQTIARTLHDLELATPKLAQLDEWLAGVHLEKSASADILRTRDVRKTLGSLVDQLDRMLNEVDPDWAPLSFSRVSHSPISYPPSLRPSQYTNNTHLTIMGPPVEKRAQKRKESHSVH